MERKQLLYAALSGAPVTNVDVRELTMQPGQQGGRHLHPCPVVGYILEGSAVLRVEGHGSIQVPRGASFFEPANVPIANFGNASATEPLRFIAAYLLNGDQPLIERLA